MANVAYATGEVGGTCTSTWRPTRGLAHVPACSRPLSPTMLLQFEDNMSACKG